MHQSKPNLQSIPLNTEDGRRLREAFIKPIATNYALEHATFVAEREAYKKFANEMGVEEFVLVLPANVGCGVMRFFETWGLVINVGSDNSMPVCERRYCFEKRADAVAALFAMKSLDDHPTGPWIKCKGTMYGRPIDLFNPNYPNMRKS